MSPFSDSVSLRLPYAVKLATERKSLTHYTKGTQSPYLGLPLFVCIGFQGLFHSPSGVLFAFPSRYWFTIGRSLVFSLGGWSPLLQTGFLVSRPTYRTLSLAVIGFAYGAFTLYGWPSQAIWLPISVARAGSSAFARHYSRNLG